METLVSVIVPIYNAEQYLEECISSITGQTYRSLQIILINDGSTDKSLSIAGGFASRDSRVVIVDQANSGVSAARQEGLLRAEGEYIIHCDSDDIVPQHAIQLLVSAAEADNLDIVVGDFIRRKDDNDYYVTHSPVDQMGFLEKLLSGEYHGSLCNKLIKRDLYEGFSFPIGLDFIEDKLALVAMLVNKTVKIGYVKSFVYIYRFVGSSYTNTMSERSVKNAHIVDGMIFSMVSNFFDDKFMAYLKNRRRIVSLLNSNISQRYNYPEANEFLLNDNRHKLLHRVLLFLDLKGIHGASIMYRTANDVRRKCMISFKRMTPNV